MTNILSFLLQLEEAAPRRDSDLSQSLIMIAIALICFYFILWRPEQKKRKALELQRSEIKKGDKVNAMGILGTVFKVQDETVILSMIDGNKIEVVKGAISDVISSSGKETE